MPRCTCKSICAIEGRVPHDLKSRFSREVFDKTSTTERPSEHGISETTRFLQIRKGSQIGITSIFVDQVMRLHGVADGSVLRLGMNCGLILAPGLVLPKKTRRLFVPPHNDVNDTMFPFLLAVKPMDWMVSDDVVHTHVYDHCVSATTACFPQTETSSGTDTPRCSVGNESKMQ